MSTSKTMGIRVSEPFLLEFRQMASELSKAEGRVIRTTDLFWRLLDTGMATLKEQMVEQNLHCVSNLSHREFSLEAARRAQKLLAFHLNSI